MLIEKEFPIQIDLFAEGFVQYAMLCLKLGMNTNKVCDHPDAHQEWYDWGDYYFIEVYCEVCDKKIYEYTLEKKEFILH